jgi:hypothetical protein
MMKVNVGICMSRGRVIACHQARSLRPLVQSFAMPYNGPYFCVKGDADELTRIAPSARTSPKRKKPVVSTPLVTPGKIFHCAGERGLKEAEAAPQSERFPSIRSDHSICCAKSLEGLVLFSRRADFCLSLVAPIRNPFSTPLSCEQQRKEGFVSW